MQFKPTPCISHLPNNTTPAFVVEQFNEHFLKKIPAGAEASNILVGELDILEHPLIAFVRLQKAVILGDLTEVPVPTRFIFVLLGPTGNQMRYHEIGRSIATLMSDEVCGPSVLYQYLFIYKYIYI